MTAELDEEGEKQLMRLANLYSELSTTLCGSMDAAERFFASVDRLADHVRHIRTRGFTWNFWTDAHAKTAATQALLNKLENTLPQARALMDEILASPLTNPNRN